MSSATLKSMLLSVTPGFLKPHWQRLEASPIGYRLAKGAFWSLVGTILARGLTVVSSVLAARMLGKAAMGELAVIQTTVGIFRAFAGVTMGLTAPKFVAEDRVKNPRRAGAMLSLSALVTWVSGAVMMLLMMLLAPWFAKYTLAAPHLAGLIRIGSVLLLLGAVNGAQTGALAGFEAFKTIARMNFISGLLSFPLMVAGAWWFGLVGAVWGLVGSVAVNCACSHLALRQEAARAGVPLRAKLEPDQWGVLWRFSLPSVLCNVIFGPVNWAGSVLLVNQPGGYAEMGLFNVTMSWYNAVTFLPGVLGQVLLPVLSAQYAEGHTGSRRFVMLATKANAIAVLPIAIILACASPLVMSFYGAEFREAWPTLIVAVFTAVVIAVHMPAAQSIIASGRMWPYFCLYVAWGVIYLGAAYVLVPFGALGYAGTRMVAYLLSSVAVFLYAAK